jgi:hypothetical protein
MTDSGILYANGTAYYEGNKIFNLYFKIKKNQVGICSFNGKTLDSTDLTNLSERQIIIIKVFGTTRFEGYIKKVTKDKYTHIWSFEGESLAGILDTRVTNIPVIVRMQENGDLPYTKELVHEAVLRFGGFTRTGTGGWQIVGGLGVPLFFYKFEARSVVDHISNLARISGYDWRCYLA